MADKKRSQVSELIGIVTATLSNLNIEDICEQVIN